jgi:hypothetical protein
MTGEAPSRELRAPYPRNPRESSSASLMQNIPGRILKSRLQLCRVYFAGTVRDCTASDDSRSVLGSARSPRHASIFHLVISVTRRIEARRLPDARLFPRDRERDRATCFKSRLPLGCPSLSLPPPSPSPSPHPLAIRWRRLKKSPIYFQLSDATDG